MFECYQSWYADAVSALAYSLALSNGSAASDPELQAPFNDLAQFLLIQHARMPDYLRGALTAATLGFDLQGCARTGRRFHTQAPELRGKQIRDWKASSLSFQRDLVRYYESLARLALHSRITSAVSRDRAGSARADSLGDFEGILTQPAAELNCEVVVVGSGPGGALTACLLAESGRAVLLLEEGPCYALESCQPFSREEMLQKYRNGGQTVALGPNKVAYVEGRCVGGGSEINSGLYHRTPSDRLEAWRKEFQVEALREADLRPHFEACEMDLSVSHLPGPAPAASLRLHQGASRLGWSSLEVPRWFRYRKPDCLQGQRQSMTQTFIPRFLRAGGRLLPGARANRLRQEGDKWEVWVEHGRGQIRVTADVAFVCGGAVQTPLLLRRSGIKANIGSSLCLHPTLKVVAKFPEPVNALDMGVPVHQVKEFAPRMSFGCSISTPAYLALGLLQYPAALSGLSDTWTHMANYYVMIAGSGRGSVRSVPGFRDALVRYGLTVEDRRDLATGARRLCELLFAADATSLFLGVVGSPELRSADQLAKLPEVLPNGLASLMTIHLFSSCPMGENKSKCAADSFGRVHGFRNLFIADGSLLCGPPGVNPQGSIMALARRNALHFLETKS